MSYPPPQQGYEQNYSQQGASSGAPFAQPQSFQGGPPQGFPQGPPQGFQGGPPPGYQGGPPQGYDPNQGPPAGYPPQGYDPNQGPPPGYPGGPPQQGYDPALGGPPQSFQQGSFQQGPPPQGYYDPSQGPPPGYGGPPPQGYDPNLQQNFALQQAEADLAALEAQKKEKDEAKKAREVEHLTHKIRSGARDQKENQACARTLCMWMVFNGLLYGLALTGDSWEKKTWWSMSIDEMTIKVGLFNMDMDLNCKDSIDNKLCQMMRPWADHDGGHWSTSEFMDAVCKDQQVDSCPTGQRLYYAGWIPLVCFPAAAGFQCLALLLLYFYWHVKPSSLTRVLQDKCGVLALTFGMFGFCGWLAAKPDLAGFPLMWAKMAGQRDAATGVFNGFKEVWIVPFGWCSMAALTAIMGNFICCFSTYGLDYHVDEPDPEGLGETAALMEEAKQEAEAYAYGTSG